MYKEVAKSNNGNIINNKKNIIIHQAAEEEEEQHKGKQQQKQQFDKLERTMQQLAMTNNGIGSGGGHATQFDGFLPPSSSSSSSSSSIEAGLDGIGGGQEQQCPQPTPKRKLKKCLHLDLLSISNANNANTTTNNNATSPASERLGGGGGILSPWNQPQFQPRRRPSKLFPVHILPHLYLGNDDTAKNRDTLDKCGIRYVVNVTSDLPNYFETAAQSNGGDEGGRPPVEYMRIPVDDNCSHNLAQFFPEAISFIEKARSERASVLVHCWAGISRSVTVCLAYLMYSLRCPLDDAFDRLLKQNGTIAPNFHFMEALTRWEQELLAASFSSSAMGIHLSAPHHGIINGKKSPTHNNTNGTTNGGIGTLNGSPSARPPPRSPSATFGQQIGQQMETAAVP